MILSLELSRCAALSRLSDSWFDRMLINLLKERAEHVGGPVGTFSPLSEQPCPRPSLQSRPVLQHKERLVRRLPAGDKGCPANLWSVASFLTALDIKMFFFLFYFVCFENIPVYSWVEGRLIEKRTGE